MLMCEGSKALGLRAGRLVLVAGLVAIGLSGCPRSPRGRDPSALPELLKAAKLATREGRSQDAQRLWTKVLRRAARLGRGPLKMSATLSLARVCAERGQFSAGSVLLEQALQVAKAAKDQRRLATIYTAGGDLRLRFGRFSEAVDQYLWAKMYAKAERMRSLQTQVVARLARIAALRGNFDFAIKGMAEATLLMITLKGLPLARAAKDVGLAYAALADSKRARRYLTQARQGYQALQLSSDSAEALVALAGLATEQGDLRGATGALESALTLLEQEGARRRHGLVAWRLSRILAAQGRSGPAERYQKLARRSLRAIGDRFMEARLDLDTARFQQRQRRFKDSVVSLQRSVKVLETLGDRFGSGEARILLGKARIQLGMAAQAVGELAKALDHTSAVGAPELSWRAYALLGFLTETLLDREEKAARFHRGAVNALERVRAGLDLIGGANAAAEDNAYFQLARVHLKHWRRSGDPTHFDAALATLERNRSRRLLDQLSRVGASLGDTLKARQRVRALSGEERNLATTLAEPGSGLALRQALFGRLSNIRSLRARLEGQALRFTAAHPAPVTLGILKQALGPGEAVLLYLVGRRRSLLIGINGERSVVVDLPGEATLGRSVKRWQDLVYGRPGGGLAAIRRQGAALHRQLVGPVASVIAGRSRVYLVLGAPLWRLAFAALPVGPSGWLGEKHAFVRIPSPSVWLKLRDTPRGQSAPRELAIFSVPGDQGRRLRPSTRANLIARGHRLEPLTGLGERVSRLVAALGSERVVQVSQVSEERFKKRDLSQYKRLHFAGRLVLPSRIVGPVQPALVLGSGTRLGDDGLLSMRELLGLTLDADLVTLEALDLGRGRPDWSGQEGVARAFLLSGARSVLLPLGPLDPKVTTRFFAAFYGALSRGLDKAVALAAARKTVAGDPGSAYVRLLATYVLYGAI